MIVIMLGSPQKVTVLVGTRHVISEWPGRRGTAPLDRRVLVWPERQATRQLGVSIEPAVTEVW